jgi:hypothetical protein
LINRATIPLTAGDNGRGGGRAALKSMTFSQTRQSIGIFTRDGKTVAALSHYQTKLRDTPRAGRPKSLIVVSQMTTKPACREYRYYLQGRSNDATGPRP